MKNIEQERKFILKYFPEDLKNNPTQKIEQGYLMFDGEKHLRVRLIDDTYGFLTYKNIISKTIKHEFEWEISKDQAIELLETTNKKFIKFRVKTKHLNCDVDIDIIPHLSLSIVEIEYEDESVLKNLPDYFGEEVTGESKYSNIGFAMEK